MGTVRIRQAVAEDFEPVLRLLDEMDETMYGRRPEGRQDDLRALYQSILSDPDQALLVAEDGGRIAGTAHLVVVRHFTRSLLRSAVVESVVVEASRRRSGIGAELMRALAEAARAAGCYKVSLTSNAARSGAHRFYSRLGWKRTHYGYSLEL